MVDCENLVRRVAVEPGEVGWKDIGQVQVSIALKNKLKENESEPT